jgi:hypothetical protein
MISLPRSARRLSRLKVPANGRAIKRVTEKGRTIVRIGEAGRIACPMRIAEKEPKKWP